MTRVGGLLDAVNETASFVGPGLGGILVVLVGPGPVLLLDAASYGGAFLLVAAPVRAVRPDRGDGDDGDGGAILGGLRLPVAAPTAALPAARDRRHGDRLHRVRRDGAGAGPARDRRGRRWRPGGRWLAARRVRRRVGAGRAPLVPRAPHRWAHSGGGRALPRRQCLRLLLPVPAWGVAVAIAGIGVSSGVFFPRFFSMLTATTPLALRARVLTSVTVVISAPGPVGFLSAGVLAQRTGGAVAGLGLVAAAATLGGIVMAAAFPRTGPSTSDA